MASSVPKRGAPLPAQIMSRAIPRDTSDIERRLIIQELTRLSRVRPRGQHCTVCGGTEHCLVYWPADEPTREHVWCNTPGDDGVYLEWGYMPNGCWYYERDRATGAVRQVGPRPTDTIPPASPETVARVLATTFGFLDLGKEHRQVLATKRGYDRADIGPSARFPFATLPADIATRGAVVMRLFGRGIATERELLGVPGFSRANRNAPILFLGKVTGTALLEGMCDADGNLIGFEYAPDVPLLDEKGKPKKRLAPRGQTKSGRYHAAGARQPRLQRIGYAEGTHKANLTCDTFGDTVVSIQGAGLYATIIQAARELDPRKRRVHTLLFDSDQWGGKSEAGAINDLLRGGYRVELGRWDAAYKGPDDAIAAGAVITYELPGAPKPTGPRGTVRIQHIYPWQGREETPEERQQLLAAGANRAAERVSAHFTTVSGDLLVVPAPPGMGKSTTVARLGQRIPPKKGRKNATYRHDIGWIAERREMAVDLNMQALGYTVIDPCTDQNCDLADVHNAVASTGRIASPIHDAHPNGCGYRDQFTLSGSAVYQLPHVETIYPAKHEGIVIDELNLSQWLQHRRYTIGDLSAVASAMSEEAVANNLLRAIQATISDAIQGGEPVYGRALFTLLDQRCQGNLAAWLAACQNNPRLTNTKPMVGSAITLEEAQALPPVVFPHIWRGLWRELVKWTRGADWNSSLWIGPISKAGEWALEITERRQFAEPKTGYLPPMAILDATADAELLAKLFGRRVTIMPETVDPPPHMRHLAVRQSIANPATKQQTIKRYGLVSMTKAKFRDVYNVRVAAEAKHVLQDIDPRREKAIGLITHKGCEQELATLLDIPYSGAKGEVAGGRTGHFWGMRGSNRLEGCDILLIIGTPCMQPEDVRRLARALYPNDAKLDESCEIVDGMWRYADPRMQRVSDALSQSELTQCAHRNRPLRHDGRVVVTMCAGTVDFLPVTTEYRAIPQLTIDGTLKAAAQRSHDDTRFLAAIKRLQAQGVKVNVHTLAAEAGVSLREASPWWQANKAAGASAPQSAIPVREGYQTPIIDTIRSLVTESNWDSADETPQPASGSGTQADGLPTIREASPIYNPSGTTPPAFRRVPDQTTEQGA